MKKDTLNMHEGTEPDLHCQGSPTRVDVAESLANTKPMGWSADSYSGVKDSPKPVVRQGGYAYKG